ncbi:hypothetical protein PLEOSDRAFT_1106981 [Pleurotus ostreatus PC15]|uniref:Uncharacterized protein n=1 Tax=Pleurotus ostreatus (strain PC15) TaxID=1137138 RepID=A0A067NGK4_PLEO1|nr:hypothetical protein PLEOSDRAFT_1106981 [Pleurotus ostreatus PC15]
MPAQLPYDVPWAAHPLSDRDAYDVDIDILAQHFTSLTVKDVPKTPSVPGAYPETPRVQLSPRVKKIINFLSLYSENNREMVENCARQLCDVTDADMFENKALNALSLLVTDGNTQTLQEPAKHLRELLFVAKKSVRFSQAPPDDDVFGTPSDTTNSAKDVRVKNEPPSSHISLQTTELTDSQVPQKTENQPMQPPMPVPIPLQPSAESSAQHDPPLHGSQDPRAPSHVATNTTPQPVISSKVPTVQATVPPAASAPPPPHISTDYNGVSAIPQDARSHIPIAQAPIPSSLPHYPPFQGPTSQMQRPNISQVPPPPVPAAYTYAAPEAPSAIPQNEPPHGWQYYPGDSIHVGPPSQSQGYYSVDVSAPPHSATRYYSPPPSAPNATWQAPRHTSAPPPAMPIQTTPYESISTPRRHISAPPPQPRGETLSTPPTQNQRSSKSSSFEINNVSNTLVLYNNNDQPITVASLTMKNNEKPIKEGYRVKARYIHCDRQSYVPVVISRPILPSNWNKLAGDLFIITTGPLGPSTVAETVWMLKEEGTWHDITHDFNSDQLDSLHLVPHPAKAIASDHFLSRRTSAVRKRTSTYASPVFIEIRLILWTSYSSYV